MLMENNVNPQEEKNTTNSENQIINNQKEKMKLQPSLGKNQKFLKAIIWIVIIAVIFGIEIWSFGKVSDSKLDKDIENIEEDEDNKNQGNKTLTKVDGIKIFKEGKTIEFLSKVEWNIELLDTYYSIDNIFYDSNGQVKLDLKDKIVFSQGELISSYPLIYRTMDKKNVYDKL